MLDCNIPEGQIRWVNVQELSDPEDAYYCATYGVPDPTITPTFPKVNIRSVRVRSPRVLGNVVRVDWEGSDFGLGVIDRLAEHQWEALMRSAVDSSSRLRLLGHVPPWPLEEARGDERSGDIGRATVARVVESVSNHRAGSARYANSNRRVS